VPEPGASRRRLAAQASSRWYVHRRSGPGRCWWAIQGSDPWPLPCRGRHRSLL